MIGSCISGSFILSSLPGPGAGTHKVSGTTTVPSLLLELNLRSRVGTDVELDELRRLC